MATRVNVSNEAFVKACLESTTIAEIAVKTGLAETTVQQRRVRLRKKNGVALPQLARGGGRKASAADLSGINAMIAQHTGRTVDEVAAEGAALIVAPVADEVPAVEGTAEAK